MYKQLKRMHAGASSEASTSNQPSEGAQSAASLSDLITQLNILHEPSTEHTGSHELNVFVNPENPNEYFALTMARATIWAKAIVSFFSSCFLIYNLKFNFFYRDQMQAVLLSPPHQNPHFLNSSKKTQPLQLPISHFLLQLYKHPSL